MVLYEYSRRANQFHTPVGCNGLLCYASCVFVICRCDRLVCMYPVVGSAVMQLWNPLISERLMCFEKEQMNGQFLYCRKDQPGEGRKREKTRNGLQEGIILKWQGKKKSRRQSGLSSIILLMTSLPFSLSFDCICNLFYFSFRSIF